MFHIWQFNLVGTTNDVFKRTKKFCKMIGKKPTLPTKKDDLRFLMIPRLA